jgi:hypothetical protein
VVGAAVINHPDNGPTTWHNISNLFMLNPVLVYDHAVEIKAGTSKTLRYRVVMHDGPSPTWVLQKLAQEYRGGR